MIRTNAATQAVPQASSSRFSRAHQACALPARRVRALFRLARHRRNLGLSLALGCSTAFASVAAASVVLHQHPVPELHLEAVTRPLAAAPKPPSAQAALSHPGYFSSLRHRNPFSGLASWYGAMWHGKLTASGEVFDEHLMTASHRTLPFGTLVRVTNLASRRSVVVKINDRGTLRPNRVIDLSEAAADQLGITDQGLARVKLEVVGHS